MKPKKQKISKFQLKKGDRVWSKIPVSATIIRVNQRYGYTLKTDDGYEYCYFDDTEVSKDTSCRGGRDENLKS